MSKVELYQSVLSKLGRLAAKEMADVDAFLTELLKREPQNKNKKGENKNAKLAGAWRDWDEEEFQSFLAHTKQIREEMFSDRKVDL